MDINIEIKERSLLVRLKGEIDLAVADTLRESLEKELDSNTQIKYLIINLTGVTYIDSSGLGVLLGRYRRVTKYGGRVFIVGAKAQVRKVLDISGLLNIMQECASEASALDHAV